MVSDFVTTKNIDLELSLIISSLRPTSALLQRLEGTDLYDEHKSFGKMENGGKSVIIRFNSPIFYGNAMRFKEEIYK